MKQPWAAGRAPPCFFSIFLSVDRGDILTERHGAPAGRRSGPPALANGVPSRRRAGAVSTALAVLAVSLHALAAGPSPGESRDPSYDIAEKGEASPSGLYQALSRAHHLRID